MANSNRNRAGGARKGGSRLAATEGRERVGLTSNDPAPVGGSGSEVLHCPIAAQCGGCAWIGSPYASQLERKRDVVSRALAVHPSLASVSVEPCIGAPAVAAYRNRAKLAVGVEKGRVRLGLYARGSNRITDLGPCRVQRPAIQAAIEPLRAWLGAHRLVAPAGPVFYLDLRETLQGGCHLTLVLDRDCSEADLALDDLARALPGLNGVALNMGDPASSYPLGPRTRVMQGASRFETTIGEHDPSGLVFEVPPTGFFQVLPAALGPVHRLMREHLGADGVLLDLYCGVGVHGIALARDVAASADSPPLIGVEESSELVSAARRNADRAGVSATFIPTQVERVVSDLVRERPVRRIILNPGRAGARAEVIEALATSGARIAYLSCNPRTLARDLAKAVDAGGRLSRVIPIDFMPQTDHVEALALLDFPPSSAR